ncbi:hypothetical protein [Haloarchaeobius sp. DT45]|uniref:hypothetical protein n=1 Tax=Haloarchaeobius sp. DT45 TaxID=3446116 RepID=UPI003F6C1DDD
MTLSSQLYTLLLVCWLAFATYSLYAYERGAWAWTDIRVGLVGTVLWTAYATTHLVDGLLVQAIVFSAGLALLAVYVHDRREREPEPALVAQRATDR